MLQVKKVTGNVLSSNMYILFEEGHSFCWVIDMGDAEALLAALPHGVEVKGVFLTHGHFDHIAGLNGLLARFPQMTVYTSEYGKEQLFSDKKNFSLYHESSFIFQGYPDAVRVLATDADTDLFADSVLHIQATPGHCPSCLTYYTDDFIFTGDSFIPGVEVVSKLPKGNRRLAQASKQQILDLVDHRTICAGHDLNKWVSLF